MVKLSKIEFSENNEILCFFENGELRLFDVQNSIKDRYIDIIISDDKILKSAQIGEFGEIYWSNMGEITDLEGNIISCEYDISPEFVYENSITIQN